MKAGELQSERPSHAATGGSLTLCAVAFTVIEADLEALAGWRLTTAMAGLRKGERAF